MKRFVRNFWPRLLLLLLLFAAATRIGALFDALDYDEIWTMSYFSTRSTGAIFTELSLPNNQPLNSLFVKFAIDAGLPLWGIRLHSLAAGVLAVMLMVPIGIRLFRSRTAALWSALFLLCSAPAAVYSQLARGYELQLCLLLLYLWGLLYHDVKKYTWPALAAAAAGGVGSILTLSTSVIYLGFITLGYFVLFPKFPPRRLLVLLLGGILFSALWYGINFHQFRTGQQWGTVITSHKVFFTFAFNTLDALIPLLWCPFLIAGIALLPRRKGAVLAGGILFVLLTAVITRGGGARVYIPLAAAAALICGAGTSLLCCKFKKFSPVIAAAALLCAAGGLYANISSWSPPDWYALFAKGKAQDQRTLVVYSGTAGFPVMWNNQPASIEDNAARINAPGSNKLLSFSGNGLLNGVDARFNEAQIPLVSRGLPCEGGFLYDLEKIRQPADKDELLIITCEEEKDVDSALFADLGKCGRFLRLNIFFESPKENGKVNIIRGGIVDKAASFNWQQLPETVKVYRIKQLERQKK